MGFIDQVKAAVPVDRFFSEHWPSEWRDHGNSVCPFHADDNASLQIDERLAYCHGCGGRWDVVDLGKEFYGKTSLKDAAEAVADEYGVELKPERTETAPRNNRAWITYPYVDENGALLFEVVRKPGKEFMQRRPDPENEGKWIYRLGDARVVLYRLPVVLPAETVWLVEGEKDADNLQGLGFVATTIPRGAKGWRSATQKHKAHEALAGKTIIICGDNDEPGREFVEAAAKTLQATAKSIVIVDLPGLGEKGDVSDFIELHGPEKAKTLLDEYSRNPPKRTETKTERLSKKENHNLTDMGNAARLASHYGDVIRYSRQLGWYLFDGRQWKEDDGSLIQGCAKDTVKKMYVEAVTCNDEDRRRGLLSFALKSESASRIAAMVQLLPSEPGITVEAETFDTNKMLFNVLNGTVDLTTGKLQAHNQEHMITKLSRVHYDPNAKSPRWEQFLMEIMDGDEALVGFLKRLLGYSMTGDTREQVWAFLWGKGENGKSTMFRTIASVMGDYAINTPAETFMEQKNQSGVRNDLARLRGARFITAAEPEGKRFNAATLKTFTGQDPITARFLHKEFFEFIPEGKLFFSANERPEVRDTSHGFWRRMLLVPFCRVFSGDDREKGLEDRLKLTETPGILNWLVQGCLEWQSDGLKIPESVRVAVDEYRTAADLLADFLESHCLIDQSQTTLVKDLYSSFLSDCDNRGIRRPMSRQKFNENMLSRPGITQGLTGPKRERTWLGIGLVPDPPEVKASPSTCGMCDFQDRESCPLPHQRGNPQQCVYYRATM